jgi:hypothetical protein
MCIRLYDPIILLHTKCCCVEVSKVIVGHRRSACPKPSRLEAGVTSKHAYKVAVMFYILSMFAPSRATKRQHLQLL